MSMASHRVFHFVGKFPDFIGPDHVAIGEMQVCRFGWIFDYEGESERNFCFCWLMTVNVRHEEAPLADCLDGGIDEKRITRNGLHARNPLHVN